MSNHVAKITRAQRQREVFELVAQGMSFRQVADELGITRKTASKDFYAMVKELKVPEPQIQEWRILIGHRLDMAEQPLLAEIAAHQKKEKTLSVRDLAEIARAIAKIEDRRARMLGIDKPLRIDVSHHLPAADPEQAAERQRARLKEAKFPRVQTAIPVAFIEEPANTDDNGNAS